MENSDDMPLRIVAAFCMVFLLVGGGLFLAVRAWRQYDYRKKLTQQGIYEIENTFSQYQDSQNGRYYARMYYMVCNPPDDAAALQNTLEAFVQEHNVPALLQERLGPRADKYYIVICFMKPTKDIPIGWRDTEKHQIGAYMEGLIATITLDGVSGEPRYSPHDMAEG